MCTKFEENPSTRRVLLHDLKIFLFWCEEEKYERLLSQELLAFKFGMGSGVYVE